MLRKVLKNLNFTLKKINHICQRPNNLVCFSTNMGTHMHDSYCPPSAMFADGSEVITLYLVYSNLVYRLATLVI